MKYTIGEKYTVKIFIDPEEMEYLGQIKTLQYNGSAADIRFDVWRRDKYGQPDLIAAYNDKFFTRTYDNLVESLVEDVGKAFRFRGLGHSEINIGGAKVSIDEFRRQCEGLLSYEKVEESILNGVYAPVQNHAGEIKYCSECKVIRQTSCSACGCGSCKECGRRWCCGMGFLTGTLVPSFCEIYPPLAPARVEETHDGLPIRLL